MLALAPPAWQYRKATAGGPTKLSLRLLKIHHVFITCYVTFI